MRALLDTHALLWFLRDDPRLGSRARDLVAAGDNDMLVSIASCWEIAIKVSIGKLTLGKPFRDFLWPRLHSSGIEVLHIEAANQLADLPRHHNDPFDRLIISQALAESLAIISVDPAFDAYGVERIGP